VPLRPGYVAHGVVNMPFPLSRGIVAGMTASDDHERLLGELEISADPFAVCALEGACSLGLGRNPGATLHYVLGGRGDLRLQSWAPIPLMPGRLVLVPSSMRHSLLNAGGPQTGLSTCEPAGLNLASHVAKGAKDGNMLVLCSTISLGLRNTHGLIDLLRTPLSLDLAASPIADRAMEGLIMEMTHPRPGRRAMIRALLLQCMIEMLRSRLEARDTAVTWMRGLVDPGLWQALRVMLDDPGAPHSLETLAIEAGMSRSRFAARFQAAYGQGPMGFLRALRLARAAQLLTQGQEPVERIARKVGFASRSAFTRAFTEVWGVTPRGLRRDAAASATTRDGRE